MSASREKKKRQDPITTEVINAPEVKKGLNKGWKKALTVVVSIVLVAAIVFLGMVSTGFFVKHTTAATIGTHKLTPAMVNYFYAGAYQSLQQNMGQLFGMMIDSTKPLKEQECTISEEHETWADYLKDAALQTAASTYAVYDEANANGYALTEEELTAIDSTIEMLDVYAPMQGFANADALLAYQYGKGSTVKSYRSYLEVSSLASSYSASVRDGFTYTQEDIDAYYTEHSEDFDAVNYRVYNLTTDAEEPTEEDLAALEETAKAMAEASKGNEQAFLDLTVENAAEDQKETYENEGATLREDYIKSETTEAYREWLFDEARQAGDTTYVATADGDGYSVVYFLGQADHSYQLPNVRHILVAFPENADKAAKMDAQAEAETILNDFLAGEATEEAFAQLADEKSDDRPEGGLYENITHGYMVKSFEDWCYDEARQIGDTGIVETEFGYHVMYFSGYGQNYQDYSVENTMLKNDFDAWYASATENASYTTNAFGMFFAA